jgi:hypothetical protein
VGSVMGWGPLEYYFGAGLGGLFPPFFFIIIIIISFGMRLCFAEWVLVSGVKSCGVCDGVGPPRILFWGRGRGVTSPPFFFILQNLFCKCFYFILLSSLHIFCMTHNVVKQ